MDVLNDHHLAVGAVAEIGQSTTTTAGAFLITRHFTPPPLILECHTCHRTLANSLLARTDFTTIAGKPTLGARHSKFD